MFALPNNNREFSLNVDQIAAIIGCPLENVQLYWPIILKAFERENIAERLVLIAALATLAVEDPEFKPLDESGNNQCFAERYEHRRDLGNVLPGDGVRYHGRGFIHLIGRSSYYFFGNRIGIDLMGHPELALNPVMAARILAVYFKTYLVAEAARREDWKQVRLLVNGHLADFGRFLSIVQRLLMVT